MSSDGKLKILGFQRLSKRSPLCERLEESSKQAIPMPVSKMNSWLSPLPPQIFYALLRIAKLPSCIALPLMQIACQPERLESVANESPWKQAQFVMRCYLKNIEKPVKPIPFSERIVYFGSPKIAIWFLEDKRIESSILETRWWQFRERDTSRDDLDATEKVRVYRDMVKAEHQREEYGLRLSPEQKIWHASWQRGFYSRQPAPGISQAEMLAYCLGCGERRDSRRQGHLVSK